MLKRFFPLLVLSLALVACGKDNPPSNNYVTSPILDVSKIEGRFGGKNPIALFGTRIKRIEGTETFEKRNFCTAFLVDTGYVLTAGHCVADLKSSREFDAPVESTANMHLFFKNPGEEHETRVDVLDVVYSEYKGQKRRGASLIKRDWAVLKPDRADELLEKFGYITLRPSTPDHGEFLEMQDENALEAFGYDPPAHWTSTATLYHRKGYIDEVRRSESNETYDVDEQLSVMQYKNQIRPILRNEISKIHVRDLQVINGNSGSPILFKGQVVGLLYGNPSQKKENETWAYAFWVPGIFDGLHKAMVAGN